MHQHLRTAHSSFNTTWSTRYDKDQYSNAVTLPLEDNISWRYLPTLLCRICLCASELATKWDKQRPELAEKKKNRAYWEWETIFLRNPLSKSAFPFDFSDFFHLGILKCMPPLEEEVFVVHCLPLRLCIVSRWGCPLSPVEAVHCLPLRLCIVSRWGCALSPVEAVHCLPLRLCIVSRWGCALSPVEAVHCLPLRLCIVSRWGCPLSPVEAVHCLPLRLCIVSRWGCALSPVKAVHWNFTIAHCLVYLPYKQIVPGLNPSHVLLLDQYPWFRYSLFKTSLLLPLSILSITDAPQLNWQLKSMR